MRKHLQIQDFWKKFEVETLKGMPTTHPLYLDFKTVFYKAIMDVLAYSHNVLGDESTGEEEGAAVLKAWHKEIHAFLGSLPNAKRQA